MRGLRGRGMGPDRPAVAVPAADGTAAYPYQATGANAAAVIAALSGLSASDGAYAMATISGGDPVSMKRVSGAWITTTPVTVTTFANLSTIVNPRIGLQATVSAQSGLSLCVVEWDGTVWRVLRVAGAWAAVSAQVLGTPAPAWYSSGGVTVSSADGAALYVTDRQSVYLHDPAVSVVAGAGGGTMALWLPADVYMGTPVVQGYGVGTESDAALTAQGLPLTETGGGTMTPVSTMFRFVATGASSSAYLTCLSAAVGTGTKYHIRCLARSTQSATGGIANNYLPYIADGTNLLRLGQYQGSSLSFRAADVLSEITTQLRSGGSVLPSTASTPDMVEYLDEGATVVASVRRNGLPYGACRRNAALAGGNAIYFGSSHGGGVSGTTTSDLSNILVMTF